MNTTEQLLRAAKYCTEAAQERAEDALTLIQVKNDPARAVEQAALAAVQNAYALERLIEAQTRMQFQVISIGSMEAHHDPA